MDISWQRGVHHEDDDALFQHQAPWETIRAKFPRLLSALDFMERIAPDPKMKTMPCCQHLMAKGDDYWIKEEPFVILFVSHTWESPNQPDPSGRQLRALNEFLLRVADLVMAVCHATAAMYHGEMDHPKRLKLVPDLLVEGTAQTTGIVMAFIDAMRKRDLPHGFGTTRASFWRHIAIFYDFSCLPQHLPHVDAPVTIVRSMEQHDEFRQAMAHLHLLCVASEVVALRFDNDNYDQRAWCSVEYNSGRAQFDIQAAMTHIRAPMSLYADHFFDTDNDFFGYEHDRGDWGNVEQQQQQQQQQRPLRLMRGMAGKHDADVATLLELGSKWIHDKDGSFLETLTKFSLLARLLEYGQHNVMDQKMMPQILECYHCRSQIQQQEVRVPTSSLDGLYLSCGHAIWIVECSLLDEWANNVVDGPKVFDLGTELDVFLRAAQLACTNGSDLTFCGLTAAATNPRSFLTGFFRTCRRAWLDLPSDDRQKATTSFKVRLHPIHMDNLQEHEEAWWEMRKDPNQFQDLSKRCHYGVNGKYTHEMAFMEKFKKALVFEVPALGPG